MRTKKTAVPWIEIGRPRSAFRQRPGEPMPLADVAACHLVAVSAVALVVVTLTRDAGLAAVVCTVVYLTLERVMVIADWVREVRYRRAADRRMLAALNAPQGDGRMRVRPRA